MDKLEQLQKLWGEDYKIIINETEIKIYMFGNSQLPMTIDKERYRILFTTDKTSTQEIKQKINETRKIMGWNNENPTNL